MATAIDWGFYSGWLRLQIDRENRQALFDVMAEIPHLQLGNFVSGTVYLLACRTVQSLGVKVTGQKNMLHHLNPAELSQLGSKLPTTEIKTFDDFDKIIPNGKEVILKIIDNIIDDLKVFLFFNNTPQIIFLFDLVLSILSGNRGFYTEESHYLSDGRYSHLSSSSRQHATHCTVSIRRTKIQRPLANISTRCN
jgi:hypothetical protein